MAKYWKIILVSLVVASVFKFGKILNLNKQIYFAIWQISFVVNGQILKKIIVSIWQNFETNWAIMLCHLAISLRQISS